MQYLTFYWRGSSDCDLSEANVERMLEFIDKALNSAESVLIHSVDGCSRACAVTAIYFMYKYVWGIDKTMLFIRHQRPDMMPQPTVAKQLDEVNQRLLYKYRTNEAMIKRISSISWEPLKVEEQQDGGEDEQLLVNTFLNSQSAQEAMMQMAKFQAGMGYNRRQRPSSAGRRNRRRRQRLSWIDEKRGKDRAMVPKSPHTGRVTAERPPGKSYSDIHPGDNWVDTMSSGGNIAGRYGDKRLASKTAAKPHPQGHEVSDSDQTIKSILRPRRFRKQQPKRNARNSRNGGEDPVRAPRISTTDVESKSKSIDRSQQSSIDINSKRDSQVNNVNTESKYSEHESTSRTSFSSDSTSAPHAKWRNDVLDTQSNRPTKNSPTQVKPDTASIRSVTSDNALAAMEYEKTKEDLNARRLDKILQNGLTGGNIEMESSVESQKGYSNFSQHSFSTSSQKRQQKAGSVNSVDGSISSLSIYTDDDSSDDDSMLLSGLRRIGAQSTNIRSKQQHDRRSRGSSSRSNRGSASANTGLDNSLTRNRGSRTSKQRVSTVGRSRQKVRRLDRGQQRLSDNLQMYERRGGTPGRERRSYSVENKERRTSSGLSSRSNGGTRRRRPPSPGLKRKPTTKTAGNYGYSGDQRRSTPQRRSRSSLQRPGSAPIRKRNSAQQGYGSSFRGGGYGVDYGTVNYSRSSLTSLKPKRAGK